MKLTYQLLSLFSNISSTEICNVNKKLQLEICLARFVTSITRLYIRFRNMETTTSPVLEAIRRGVTTPWGYTYDKKRTHASLERGLQTRPGKGVQEESSQSDSQVTAHQYLIDVEAWGSTRVGRKWGHRTLAHLGHEVQQVYRHHAGKPSISRHDTAIFYHTKLYRRNVKWSEIYIILKLNISLRYIDLLTKNISE